VTEEFLLTVTVKRRISLVCKVGGKPREMLILKAERPIYDVLLNKRNIICTNFARIDCPFLVNL
jgi:hypothetical protein